MSSVWKKHFYRYSTPGDERMEVLDAARGRLGAGPQTAFHPLAFSGRSKTSSLASGDWAIVSICADGGQGTVALLRRD
jgi:hypothetical protein